MPSHNHNALTAATYAPWAAIVLRRAFQAVAVAVVVGTLCFAMMQMLPGDMAMRIAASRYGYDYVGNAAASAVNAELGLDRPLWQALAQWLGQLLRLDLGTSAVTGEPVWREITHQLGATLQLSAVALVMAACIGLPLGVWAGLHAGGWVDKLTLALAAILRAIPPFLLALALMVVVAVRMGVLPVAGHGNDGSSLLLPSLTLGLGLAAGLARVARNAMHDVATSPSYEFARTKGLSDWQALLRHGLRQAAVPIVAYLGVHAVFLVEGAVVVESLFAWPGIGHALVHAVFGRDVPVIQGVALCMGLMFVLFNLLIDAFCLMLDPRQRMGGASSHA